MDESRSLFSADPVLRINITEPISFAQIAIAYVNHLFEHIHLPPRSIHDTNKTSRGVRENVAACIVRVVVKAILNCLDGNGRFDGIESIVLQIPIDCLRRARATHLFSIR